MQDASHHDSQHVSGVLHPDDLAAVNLREVARQQQAALPSGDHGQYPSSLQESAVQTQAHDPVLAHKSANMAAMEAEGTGDLQDGNFKVSSPPFQSEQLSQQQGTARMLMFCSFPHTVCALSQAGTYAPPLHLCMVSLSDWWSTFALQYNNPG